jgi:microcystin-dependent protein
MESYMGQIMQVGFNYAPLYWATCQGQLMAISQNSALFSLLGTTFGGDGVTTFGLPNAQGRTLIGVGQGSGLQPYSWGQIGGVENTTLNSGQMPQHVHPVGASTMTSSLQAISDNTLANTTDTPEGGARLGVAYDSGGSATPVIYVPSSVSGTPVNLGGVQISGTTGIAGSSQPFSLLQPYLAVTTLICTAGLYPPRQ